MRPLFLFVIFICLAKNLFAQQKAANITGLTIENLGNRFATSSAQQAHGNSAARAQKTTIGGGRWYRYNHEVLTSSVWDFGFKYFALWNDTSSIQAAICLPMDTSSVRTYYNNKLTSIGVTLDPFTPLWMDPLEFCDMIQITPADNYVIDSVMIWGVYGRNYSTPAKRAVVDTLILAFVQGNGASGSDIETDATSDTSVTSHYVAADTMNYLQIFHDGLNNRASHRSGSSLPSTAVYKVLLSEADTAIWGSGVNMPKIYPRPGHLPPDPVIAYSVAAGNMAAMTVTFKSGDHSYPASPLKDTVVRNWTNFKYGDFLPISYYNTSAYDTVPLYIWSTDRTAGFFKFEGDTGWPGKYTPHWFLKNSTGGPSVFQYPWVDFHIACPTCPFVPCRWLSAPNEISISPSVNVYPSPANDELTISLAPGTETDLSISLINMMGQNVRTQKIINSKETKVTLDVSDLAAGPYLYVIRSSSDQITGHVSIIH